MRDKWRLIVVLLVLANLGYFAWRQGAFSAFGFQPAHFSETEPQRMDLQVRPELLQLRPAP